MTTRATGSFVALRIEAALANDRPADSDRPFGDLVCSTCDDGRLRLTRKEQIRGMLEQIAAAANMRALAASLAIMPDAQWTWVSLWIGTMLRLGGEEGGTASALTAAAIEPWSRWFG